jgi:hypothetical protein
VAAVLSTEGPTASRVHCQCPPVTRESCTTLNNEPTIRDSQHPSSASLLHSGHGNATSLGTGRAKCFTSPHSEPDSPRNLGDGRRGGQKKARPAYHRGKKAELLLLDYAPLNTDELQKFLILVRALPSHLPTP